MIGVVKEEIAGAEAFLRNILLLDEIEVVQEYAADQPSGVLKQATKGVHELAVRFELSLLLIIVLILILVLLFSCLLRRIILLFGLLLLFGYFLS